MYPPTLGENHALFLDFDGTLVELADGPELIEVPSALAASLTDIQQSLGGALAVVSGREIANLAKHLEGFAGPYSGSHGMEMSDGNGDVVGLSAVVAAKAANISASLRSFVNENPGLLLESKQYSVSLHYRNAPEARDLCQAQMQQAIQELDDWTLLDGKFVFEVRPSGVSKYTAVQEFMKLDPFKGRIPVFIGDDTTDEDGMRAARELGGFGIKVGVGESESQYRLTDANAVFKYITNS